MHISFFCVWFACVWASFPHGFAPLSWLLDEVWNMEIHGYPCIIFHPIPLWSTKEDHCNLHTGGITCTHKQIDTWSFTQFCQTYVLTTLKVKPTNEDIPSRTNINKLHTAIHTHLCIYVNTQMDCCGGVLLLNPSHVNYLVPVVNKPLLPGKHWHHPHPPCMYKDKPEIMLNSLDIPTHLMKINLFNCTGSTVFHIIWNKNKSSRKIYCQCL